MRIVAVIPELRSPPLDGGSLRMHAILSHLASRHELALVVAAPAAPTVGDIEALRSYSDDITLHVRPWTQFRKAASLTQSLLLRRPFVIHRYSPADLSTVVADVVSRVKADLALSGMHYLAPSLDRCQAARVSDMHDVAHLLYDRFAAGRWGLKRIHGMLQRPIVREFERRVLRSFDACTVVSALDRQRLLALVPDAAISVIENGVSLSKFTDSSGQVIDSDILFAGSLDYYPNTDAVTYLVERVLPIVWSEAPHVRVRIVGRAPEALPKGILQHPRIQVSGNVPSVVPYFRGTKIFIVPLRTGGGTRLKVLEAGAARLPVVATSVGVEGLRVTAGRDVAVGDSEISLARQTLDLLKDEGRRTELAESLQKVVTEEYSWDSVLSPLDSVLAQAVERAEQRRGKGSWRIPPS